MARPNADPEAAMRAASADIDARLAALPDDQRAALEHLRRTIAGAAPDAVETISYGMPAFRYHGRILMWYHAAKRHCSLFPGPGAIEAHATGLATFDVAKGTIRFTPTEPLPDDLVASIVRSRMATIDAQPRPRGR